jgi:hypothetical protein
MVYDSASRALLRVSSVTLFVHIHHLIVFFIRPSTQYIKLPTLPLVAPNLFRRLLERLPQNDA